MLWIKKKQEKYIYIWVCKILNWYKKKILVKKNKKQEKKEKKKDELL